MKNTFDVWYAENRTNKMWMNAYMDYFYNWEGWAIKTNQDPDSYRAYMKKMYEKSVKAWFFIKTH